MRTLTLLSFIFSFSALACPNLSGTYEVCKVSNGQEADMAHVTIEQKVINKITHYTIRSVDPRSGDEREENYIADNKTKLTSLADPDTGTVVKTETKASCQGNYLNVSMNVTIDSQPLAKISAKVFIENLKLVQQFSGESMGEAVNYISVCQ